MANKINSIRTKIFFLRDINDLPLRVSSILFDLREKGWTFSVTDQTRGWVRASTKEITIPVWVCDEKHRADGKFIQYISHELAHAVHFLRDARNNRLEPHGQMFMQIMMEICPPEYWHHELLYKPKNAASAGVSTESYVNVSKSMTTWKKT